MIKLLPDILLPEFSSDHALCLDEASYITDKLFQINQAITKFESDRDLDYLLDLLDSIPEFNLDEWTDNVTEEIELYL